MIDIREPKKPTFAGCFAATGTGRTGTGYSHDAQCVTYKGPDARYKGHEICIGSNETAISIADVTDKKNPKALSHASYPNVAYAHQGWFTDDHKYFYLDDEIDELQYAEAVPRTRTLVWDLTDLENPRLAKEHIGVATSSDHNLYVLGNQVFQANYMSGLRILDIEDRENPKEVSFFDTDPYRETTPGYSGAWSVYPYFKSGAIVVNSIEQGLFIVKQTPRTVF
jgi:choice-of-anchor B domain-containing protein